MTDNELLNQIMMHLQDENAASYLAEISYYVQQIYYWLRASGLALVIGLSFFTAFKLTRKYILPWFRGILNF